MNIAMFTNLYFPKVGGVSISVDRFARACRERGHEVLIVAPNFPQQERDEPGVFRVSAIQKFNGTDFSVALPPGLELLRALDEFEPDLIHSHHPFLLGDSAARAATHRDLPLVYTHHTMYEHYTHYVPMDSKLLRNYVVQLTGRYADMCQLVIAPSRSVADILRRRGVSSSIEVIPTGLVVEDFRRGDRNRGRSRMGIGDGEFVIGHVGRLAEEKNLDFLTRAVIRAMREMDGSRFLVVGDGDLVPSMRRMIDEAGLSERAIFAGLRNGQELADLYAAMDVFAFASKSETQGMVLAEAMSAGAPIVVLNAPGARDVVRDGHNGRLVPDEDEAAFARALRSMARLEPEEARAYREEARADAEEYSIDRCADRVLAAYRTVLDSQRPAGPADTSDWDGLLQTIRREWDLWANRAASLTDAIVTPNDPKEEPH